MYEEQITPMYLVGVSPKDVDLIEILEDSINSRYTPQNIACTYYKGSLDRIRQIGVVLKSNDTEHIYPAVTSVIRGGSWVRVIFADYAAVPIWSAVKLLKLPKISPYTLALDSLMWNFPVSYRKDRLRQHLGLKQGENLEEILTVALSEMNRAGKMIELKENQDACTFYRLNSSPA